MGAIGAADHDREDAGQDVVGAGIPGRGLVARHAQDLALAKPRQPLPRPGGPAMARAVELDSHDEALGQALADRARQTHALARSPRTVLGGAPGLAPVEGEMLALRPRAQEAAPRLGWPREGAARDVGAAFDQPADGVDAHIGRPHQQRDGDRQKLRADQPDDGDQRDARGDTGKRRARHDASDATVAVKT